MGSDNDPGGRTLDAVRLAINWTQLLLVALVIGFGWVLLQFNGLPDAIAGRFPGSDSSGMQADAAVDTIQQQLVAVQVKLDDLTVRLDRVCAIVAADHPSACPKPLPSP